MSVDNPPPGSDPTGNPHGPGNPPQPAVAEPVESTNDEQQIAENRKYLHEHGIPYPAGDDGRKA